MSERFDVIIIGAGVVGASIARMLSGFRLRTALVEREADVSFGTSKANSGIIHAGFHSAPGKVMTTLCIKGNRAFDRLSRQLSFGFERRGELVAAFSDEEVQVLQNLYQQGKANGVLHMELIGRDRALEMEPALNPDVEGALFAPTAGIIEPYEYCFALVENAVQNGVELFLEHPVTHVGRIPSGEFLVETSAGLSATARYVVNAAGLYADEIAAHVGITNFKIHARKGEEYLLDRRVGGLVRRILFPVPTGSSKGMLIIPTVEGPVMVGPTADDIDRKDDFSTTRDGLKRVFESAQKMVPAIRSTDVITSFVGLRPVATGGDFIIGPTKVPGFINACGIQSPGLTASPAIADMIKAALVKEGLKLEPDLTFKPMRKPFIKFRNLVAKKSIESINRYLTKFPGYARLVCRCENVTEAEVVEAIRRGHTTMDGIKFATRAGMGRCQGGFCTTRIMKLIARETGKRIEEITKKGAGTELIRLRLSKGAP